jgi:hypothetical protein
MSSEAMSSIVVSSCVALNRSSATSSKRRTELPPTRRPRASYRLHDRLHAPATHERGRLRGIPKNFSAIMLRKMSVVPP